MVADYGSGAVNLQQVEAFGAAVQKLPDVAEVGKAVASRDGHLALLEITSTQGPESDRTFALVALGSAAVTALVASPAADPGLFRR